MTTSPNNNPTPEPIFDNAPGSETAGEAFEGTLVEMGPWMLSLMAHLGVIILALFLVWSTMVAGPDEPVGPVSVDLTKKTDKEPLKLSDNPDLSKKKSQRNPKTETVVTPRPDFRPVDSKVPDIIGVGPTNDLSKFINQAPTSGDDGLFEDPGKTPPGGERPGRIVFIIDASGSVIDGFDFVINELRATIRKLDEDQKFTVIFFQRGFAMEATDAKGRGMKPATLERKTAISNWITPESGRVSPAGSSDPRPALKLAFAYKPDLVYILSDNITGRGIYQLDRDKLLNDIDTLNVADATIHTIQFLYPDPLATLETIAQRTKGKHRFVGASELTRRAERRKGPGA